MSRDKALRDLHNEVKGKWQRPLAQCSVGADLPRFVRKIAVINDSTGEVDFNGGGDETTGSNEGADAAAQSSDAQTADLICQLLKVFATALDAKKETKAMEKSLELYFGPRSKSGSAPASTGSFDVSKETDRFCREILGESSRVTSLLKVAASQGIVAPAWMKLRLFILSRFGFKDVKRGWNIVVLHSDTKVTVVHRKREASNDETTGHAEFEFTWEMRMSFSRKMEKLEQASFVITNVQVSPNMNEKKLAGLRAAILEWFLPNTELFPRDLFRSASATPIIPNAITLGNSPREMSSKKDKKKKSFGSVAKEWLGRGSSSTPSKSESPAPTSMADTSTSSAYVAAQTGLVSPPMTPISSKSKLSKSVKPKASVEFNIADPIPHETIGHPSAMKAKPTLRRQLSDSSSESVIRHRRQRSFDVHSSDSEQDVGARGASADSSGSMKGTMVSKTTSRIPSTQEVTSTTPAGPSAAAASSSSDFIVTIPKQKSSEFLASPYAVDVLHASKLKAKKRASAGPSSRRSRTKSAETGPAPNLTRLNSGSAALGRDASQQGANHGNRSPPSRSPSSSPPPVSILHASAVFELSTKVATSAAGVERDDDSVGPRSRSSTHSSLSWSSDLSWSSLDQSQGSSSAQNNPLRVSGEHTPMGGRARSTSTSIVVTTRKRTTSIGDGAVADLVLLPSHRQSIKSQSSLGSTTSAATLVSSGSAGNTSPATTGPASPVQSPPSFGHGISSASTSTDRIPHQSSSGQLSRRVKDLKDSDNKGSNKESTTTSSPKDAISRRKSVGSKESGHFNLKDEKDKKEEKDKKDKKDKEDKKKKSSKTESSTTTAIEEQ